MRLRHLSRLRRADHASYETPEERLAAAQQVAHLWNIGKVLNPGVGD